ncbi:MAG: GntR family transcriptional regulator [Planctomycetes bacterium]|nr:GntR family transcriptional regulator [Planctomycetota bacterium]MCP4861511.1 GntR family transcriptional regulator [Planctomycetota bacterium]
MLLLIDRHNGIPAYRQIMDQIRFQVASGVLSQGDEMPSTRNLSAELGMNPMTVSKAYGFLEQEGLLMRRPGRPLVVAELTQGLESQKVEQLRAALAPVLVIAKQLGLDRNQTLQMFTEMLDEEASKGEQS